MAKYFNLKLINSAGVPVAYPGTPTPFEVGSETSVEKVWIGMSADGTNNQIYPIDTTIATIMASWARVYQGIQISGGPYDGNVYLNSLFDFEYMTDAACCFPDIAESPSESESASEPEAPFDIMMRVTTSTPSEEFAFFLVLFAPAQFYVDWGDGSAEEPFFGDSEIPTHAYTTPGDYTVRMRFEPPSPTSIDTIQISNVPLTYFAFSPEFVSGGLSMNVLQLDSTQLGDDGIDFTTWEFVAVNTVILANNQFTNAILGLLPSSFTTLNVNGNNFGTMDLGVLGDRLNTLGNLFADNCQLATIDLTDWNNDVQALHLSNNLLEGFNIGDISVFALGDLNLSGNSLPQTDIDAILQALDAQGNENGIVNLSGQIPNMPPSLAGAVAVGSLESKFWTVTVDA